MWPFSILQRKKRQALQRAALEWGLVLYGFNLALFLVLFLANHTVREILGAGAQMVEVVIYLPLVLLFMFAAISAVVWYRFGMHFQRIFKDQPLVWSSFAVGVSVIALFASVVFIATIANILMPHSSVVNEAVVSMTLLAILAAIFEFVIVSLGVAVKSE